MFMLSGGFNSHSAPFFFLSCFNSSNNQPKDRCRANPEAVRD